MPATGMSPPGPWNLNSALGLTWRHAASFWWDPTRFFTRLAEQHGDLVFFRMFTHRCYLLNQPEWIWQMYVTERDAFVKWPQQMRVIRSLFGNSILTSEGDGWRQQRLDLQPFFTPHALRESGAIFQSTVKDTLATWPDEKDQDLEPELDELLVRITVLGIFGYDVAERAKDLVDSVRVLSRCGNSEMFELIPLPNSWPRPGKRRKERALAEVRKLIYEVLRQPRQNATMRQLWQQQAPGNEHAVRIIDHLMTIFVAAVHTTSAWISWTIKLLAREPKLQLQIAEELARDWSQDREGIEETPASDLLDRVLQESLRLYPPAWGLFARQATRDVYFGDFKVPSGGVLFVLPHVMHRDAKYYPDPLRFDPARFLPDAISQRPRGSYFPFGLGPHLCAGAALARLQARAVVGQLVARFHLAPRSDDTFRTLTHLANRPRDGVRVILQQRTDQGISPE